MATGVKPQMAGRPVSQAVGISSPISLQRTLWQFGGFDVEFLSQERCRSVRAKYSSMGALVLMTAVLACCSATYALWTIFKNPWGAAVAGLCWGVMIFSLDRYLLSSARKLGTIRGYITGKHQAPPYKETNPKAQLVIRLVLAFVIGLIVSKPLEVRILQPWVNEYERQLADQRLQAAGDDNALRNLITREQESAAQLDNKRNEINKRRDDLKKEADGTGGTRTPGEGPHFKFDEVLFNQAKDEEARLQRDTTTIRNQIDAIRKKEEGRARADTSARNEERSIISDLKDIDALSSDAERGPLVKWVAWTLTALFVIIESAPVLAKSLSPLDPYDGALEEFEHGEILDSLGRARRKHQQSMDDE